MIPTVKYSIKTPVDTYHGEGIVTGYEVIPPVDDPKAKIKIWHETPKLIEGDLLRYQVWVSEKQQSLYFTEKELA